MPSQGKRLTFRLYDGVGEEEGERRLTPVSRAQRLIPFESFSRSVFAGEGSLRAAFINDLSFLSTIIVRLAPSQASSTPTELSRLITSQ
ncbi:hypothetical protein Hypma_013851 [Hypsizygus marmoreus]|uniref:Uncharacterized protein n=1 Tax=Hypsizygus marmoreus TaxID=39966 RepID=A0A369K8I6_HYPMA|nr:hypothetical protein Hypma_013851 [Hypsizygus marmoreus]